MSEAALYGLPTCLSFMKSLFSPRWSRIVCACSPLCVSIVTETIIGAFVHAVMVSCGGIHRVFC